MSRVTRDSAADGSASSTFSTRILSSGVPPKGKPLNSSQTRLPSGVFYTILYRKRWGIPAVSLPPSGYLPDIFLRSPWARTASACNPALLCSHLHVATLQQYVLYVVVSWKFKFRARTRFSQAQATPETPCTAVFTGTATSASPSCLLAKTALSESATKTPCAAITTGPTAQLSG